MPYRLKRLTVFTCPARLPLMLLRWHLRSVSVSAVRLAEPRGEGQEPQPRPLFSELRLPGCLQRAIGKKERAAPLTANYQVKSYQGFDLRKVQRSALNYTRHCLKSIGTYGHT